MRIDILPVSGSPRNIIPDDIYNRGVGGSELFCMALWKLLAQNGYDIYYYNDPHRVGNYDGVHYLPNYAFDPNIENRVLISFRGYDPRIAQSKRIKHIGISTDQFTNLEYPYDKFWYPSVDKMIGISEFHKQDHLTRYGECANKMQVIDIGSDPKEYNAEIEKIPYQCIYCSVPDRGLQYLAEYWDVLKEKIPELKLILSSDYRLWGVSYPANEKYREMFKNKRDVEFLGKIDRVELIKYQLQSEVQLYPCDYQENFCIANSECQMAGCFTITSNQGALCTTNMTLGRINGVPTDNDFAHKFISRTVEYFNLSFEQRKDIGNDIKMQAHNRFSWNRILPKWLEILNG